MTEKKYPLTTAIAGTTHRTVSCTAALLDDARFSLEWILTPTPKPIGRKQVLTPNPLDSFANEHHLPVIHISEKVDQATQTAVKEAAPIDFLLVVDFGYFVPKWLLDTPATAPLNIHPSELPKWRGSSPAQFSILFGDTDSAVTLMRMNSSFDQGPLIAQIPFSVPDSWTSEDYYKHSFSLITAELPDLIETYYRNRDETPQPKESPTVIAQRITKEDAFIPWNIVNQTIKNSGYMLTDTDLAQLSPLLRIATKKHHTAASLVDAACRAFWPWPKLWTVVSTQKGEKRMQIHEVEYRNENDSDAATKFELRTVQLEGQSAAAFNQVKNILSPTYL